MPRALFFPADDDGNPDSWQVQAGEYADEPDLVIVIEHAVSSEGKDRRESVAREVAALLNSRDALAAEVERLRGVAVIRCPECEAGEPCQLVSESSAIARPETGDGAEGAPSPMRDEPAPSPDDPHGACSRMLLAMAVERDKALARAARLADQAEAQGRATGFAERERDALAVENARLRAQVQTVEALHEDDDGWCAYDGSDFPCATIRALAATEAGEES